MNHLPKSIQNLLSYKEIYSMVNSSRIILKNQSDTIYSVTLDVFILR